MTDAVDDERQEEEDYARPRTVVQRSIPQESDRSPATTTSNYTSSARFKNISPRPTLSLRQYAVTAIDRDAPQPTSLRTNQRNPLTAISDELAGFCSIGANAYASCVTYCAKRPGLWDDVKTLLRVAHDLAQQEDWEKARQVVSRYAMLHLSEKQAGINHGARLQWLAELQESRQKREEFEDRISRVMDALEAWSERVKSSNHTIVSQLQTQIQGQRPSHLDMPYTGQARSDRAVRRAGPPKAEELEHTILEPNNDEVQKSMAKLRQDRDQARTEASELAGAVEVQRASNRSLEVELGHDRGRASELNTLKQKQLAEEKAVKDKVRSSSMRREEVQRQLNAEEESERHDRDHLDAMTQAHAKLLKDFEDTRAETEQLDEKFGAARQYANDLSKQTKAQTAANDKLLDDLNKMKAVVQQLQSSLQSSRSDMLEPFIHDAPTFATRISGQFDVESLTDQLRGIDLESPEVFNTLSDHAHAFRSLTVLPNDHTAPEHEDGTERGTNDNNSNQLKRKADPQHEANKSSEGSGHSYGKRKRCSTSANGVGDSDDDEHDGLACPYFVKDPQRYRACGKLRLMTIAALKQHLQRKHKGPEYYCYRCFREFTSEVDAQIHGQVDACIKAERSISDKIGRDKWKSIDRRHRGFAPAEAWHDIYETIFDEPASFGGATVREHEIWLSHRETSLQFSRFFAAFPGIRDQIQNEAHNSSLAWMMLPAPTQDIVRSAFDATGDGFAMNDTAGVTHSNQTQSAVARHDLENNAATSASDCELPYLSSSPEIETSDLYGSNATTSSMHSNHAILTPESSPAASLPLLDADGSSSRSSNVVSDTNALPMEEDWSFFIEPGLLTGDFDTPSTSSRNPG